jgi:hypothetical protein
VDIKRLWVDKEARERLAFFGGGIGAIAGAAWVVFTHFSSESNKVPTASNKVPTIAALYHVCVGNLPDLCPPNTLHLACGTNVGQWAQKECASYLLNVVSSQAGGMCGATVIEITCTTGK